MFMYLTTIAMSFPQLTAITNNIGEFVKAMGLGLFLAVLGVIALIFMTSFGNERRVMLAKSAVVMAVLGWRWPTSGPCLRSWSAIEQFRRLPQL